MMGESNGWVKEHITDAFEVPGENENSRRMDDFCAEKVTCG